MKNVDIEKLTKVTWRSPHRDSVISIPNSLSWLSAYHPSILHPPIYYLYSLKSDAITKTLFPKYLNLCFIDWTYYLFMGVQCLFGDIFISWTMNLDDMKCVNLKAVIWSMFTNPYTCALTPRSKPTESPEPRQVLYVPHPAIQPPSLKVPLTVKTFVTTEWFAYSRPSQKWQLQTCILAISLNIFQI